MMFMLGVMLFSSLVMMPQFLQTLLGYTAESAGLVLSASGVVLLVEHADRRPAHHEIPGQIHHCFWLALARPGHVLFHHTDRSE